MNDYWIELFLHSDTAFGRGDGVAGMVDAEVQHDEDGMPYMGGKTLKGLLVAACAEVLYAVEQAAPAAVESWRPSGRRLFGARGSGLNQSAIMHVGDAKLPADLRAAVASDTALGRRRHSHRGLKPEEVLDTLTTLRHQSAMDPETGGPRENTLRTTRLVVRDTRFIAALVFLESPSDRDLALLAACISALRRVGSVRNRGWGRVTAELYASDPVAGDDGPVEPITASRLQKFRRELRR